MMRRLDDTTIELYLNNDSIEINPKVFWNNIIICWYLSLFNVLVFSVRGILLVFTILVNLLLTVLFISLKKNVQQIGAQYLCQGIAFQHWSLTFFIMGYNYFSSVYGSNIYTISIFIVLYLILVVISLLLEYQKINSFKIKDKEQKTHKKHFVIFAILGVIFAQLIGTSFAYNEVISIATVICTLLSFVLLIPIGCIFKAYFIFSKSN